MTSLANKPALSLSRVAIYAVLIVAVFIYLVPLVVMLLTSFKSPEDIGNLLSWPTEVTGIGWIKAWATVKGYFWNSFLITVPAVLISTTIGALNGYVLSMWRFRGSQLFFGLLLFGCFLPFQTVLLPASFTLGKMGLASTRRGWYSSTSSTAWRSPHCSFATTTSAFRMRWSKRRVLTVPGFSRFSAGSFCRCRHRSSWSA
jgi:glucose/mannose transport system permease protein